MANTDEPDPLHDPDSKIGASDQSVPSDDKIVAAIHRIIEEREAYWEAQKPPALPADAEGLLQPAAITSCPFPHTVLARRFAYGIPLTPDEKMACDQARSLVVGRVLERHSVSLTPVRPSLPAGQEPAYHVGCFGHAELRVWSHAVHLEVICLTLSSPGGVNNEVRIYVDGVLRGRGILFGRSGGSGNSFPALAMITRAVVMRVSPVAPNRFDTLIVEVARRARAAAAGTRNDTGGEQ